MGRINVGFGADWAASVGGRPEPTGFSAPAAAPARASLLLVSSNGSGMGHLTRLMAYARRLEADLSPHFLSLLQAVGVVARYGYPFEYVPSAGVTGLLNKRWHDLFAGALVIRWRRRVRRWVVFDGTWPYQGIKQVREAHPEV